MNTVTLKDFSAARACTVLSTVAMAVFALSRPLPATAQAAESAEAVTLAEVVVTARRREESLQDVPLSISALNSENLEARNVTDLRQVNGTIPNVVIQGSQFSGPVGSQFRIRGVPGVVVYQDGAILQGGALPNFTDIERVEVARGPQGTLFGRSAIGGAIQIVTKAPQHEFGADVRTAFGNNSRVDLTANVNIPIGEILAVKLTGSSLQRDGFVSSTKIKRDFGSQDDKMARADVLFTPFEKLSIRAQYARFENKSTGIPYVTLGLQSVCTNAQAPTNWFDGNGIQRFTAPNAYCLYTTLDLDPNTPGLQAFNTEYQTYGAIKEYKNTIDDPDSGWTQIINDVRLDANLELNDTMAMRLLASRRYFRTNSYEDLDGTGLDLWVNRVNPLTERGDLKTAELQFLYSGSRLTGTTGIYWEKNPGFYSRRINWINNDISQSPTLAAAAAAAYPGSTTTHAESRPQLLAGGAIPIGKTVSEQKAAFTEWTLGVTEKFKVTAGIRYTDVENTSFSVGVAGPTGRAACPIPALYQSLVPGCDYFGFTGAEPTGTNAGKFKQWTPRFSAQYQWTPDVMTYATFSKGKETGGTLVIVNPNAQAILGFGNYQTFPGAVNNYEVGARTDLLNGTLRLNASVFFNDYKNVTLSEELLPGQLFNANADAEIKGGEIEATWLVTNAFQINATLGKVDAKYTTKGTTRNLLPGTPFALTPELSYTLGAQYGWNLNNGNLTLRGDYNWQDDQISASDRITAYPIPSIGLLSGRLTYRPNDAKWDIALLGTNLLDEYYVTSAFYQPQTTAAQGTAGRPREYAVQFNVRF
jgi:iron complex outermembrane receptor protein